MEKYIVDGGIRLNGSLRIHGSKNAVLPMLAATIINKGISVIENVPNIYDVKCMLTILKQLGCEYTLDEGILIIDSIGAMPVSVEKDIASKVRTSVLFCGAMLAAFGEAHVAEPGGCAIGTRPIDIHLDAFEKMGAKVIREDGMLHLSVENLLGIVYNMPFPSVGATQNIIMAALGAKGMTVIMNAAKEPEILEFGTFLKNMGAVIEGLGTDKIIIHGKKNLTDTAYVLDGDRIVAGTYMAACAMTGGDIILENISLKETKGYIEVFESMGCQVCADENRINFRSEGSLNNPLYIETSPFPGFPTDMQSQFMSLMSVSKGSGCIVEKIFENRFGNAAELRKMGANISVNDNKAVIKGVGRLKGAEVYSHDLRGGAALIIAALAAEGRSVIWDDGFIGRGYEDIRRDLCLLGAHIK